MESEVPFIITKQLKCRRQLLFKVRQTKETGVSGHTNQQTLEVGVRDRDDGDRSVSRQEKSTGFSRGRRICSSAASKRFPKDFFRAETCA